MKKLFAVAFSILASTLMYGQHTVVEKDGLSSFSEVVIENDFNVRIVNASTHSVTFGCEQPYADYVSAVVKGGALVISLDTKNIPSEVKKAYRGKNTPTFSAEIKMPVDDITKLTVGGKSDLEVTRDIVTKNIVITVSDQATVHSLNVTARTAQISADKKSSIIATLAADHVEVAATGSSKLDVNQNSNKCEVKLQGSSNLTLHGAIHGALEFTAKSSSKATISGSADSATFTTSGGVNINALSLAVENAVVDMSGYGNLTESATKRLTVTLSGGSTLIYNNSPVFDIENVKSSTISKYSSTNK